MSIVYTYIKDFTKGKNIDGKQVKITSQDLIENLELNEQTIHRNLRDLIKHGDICYTINKIRRYKDGRNYIFNMKLVWIE